MRSADVRSSFLRYFEELDHRVVPSSSLVPAGDPTLFFANAGMNQFKDVFTGRAPRESARAASCQKCMRVSGKHNDFETVGRSLRHHTFFEMLGNFSFGDYFKREAILWAWSLLTQRYGIDPARLVATVFQDDDEAESIWRRDVGLPSDRVFRLGAADNYWSMGETGPQGPCSEIHVDFGAAAGCGRAECDPGCSCDRYLEIWNLVFMQYDRSADGTLSALPSPSIDTGMGLERISALLQGTASTFDTDLFQPLLAEISRRSGVAYRSLAGRDDAALTDERQVSMRVVADHVRAVTFLLADGVFPSNEGRGYVLRKILRRAAGHASKLGLQAPALSELTAVVVATMGDAYPELRGQADLLRAACAREEKAFEATLEQGSTLLAQVVGRVRERAGSEVSGADAFRLHDTFGFPLELTVEMASREGLTVDRAGFEAELEAQRERARAAAKAHASEVRIPEGMELPPTEFRGYQETTTDACRVVAALAGDGRTGAIGAGSSGWVVLDRTPFYAESGGQVGDAGELAGEGLRAIVEDTQALRPGVTGHRVRVEAGTIGTGAVVRAVVDAPRRRRIMANHTATHLLHRALKDVLGEGVRQAGSLVAPDRLRFDFNYPQSLTREQVEAVERRVNDMVFAHRPVIKQEMPHAEALRRGAVAMFGEKYGERVRVVSVDEWSVELCGGTHCDRTEQVGALHVISERGVAAGVRRIEAVTGPGILERLVEDERLIEEAGQLLRTGRGELLKSVQALSEQVRSLRRELDEARRQAATGSGAQAPGGRHEVAGFRVEWRLLPDLDVGQLREAASGAREQAGSDALLLGSVRGGKAGIVLALSPRLVERLGGEPARELVTELAREVGGGGGGRAELAWAGGRQADRLEAALAALPGLLGARLESRAAAREP